MQSFRESMDEYFPMYFWVSTVVYENGITEESVGNLNDAIKVYQELMAQPSQGNASARELMESEICSSIDYALEKIINDYCITNGIEINQLGDRTKKFDYEIQKRVHYICCITEDWDYEIRGRNFKLDYQIEISLDELNSYATLTSLIEEVIAKAIKAVKRFLE